MDAKAVIASAKKTGAVVTAEEHQIMGGFGSAIAEVLVQNYSVPMKFVGVQDRFGGSGKPDELMKEFHLIESDIIKAVKEVLEMKE
jgi:transketolase